jgi:hypothetical protein
MLTGKPDYFRPPHSYRFVHAQEGRGVTQAHRMILAGRVPYGAAIDFVLLLLLF